MDELAELFARGDVASRADAGHHAGQTWVAPKVCRNPVALVRHVVGRERFVQAARREAERSGGQASVYRFGGQRRRHSRLGAVRRAAFGGALVLTRGAGRGSTFDHILADARVEEIGRIELATGRSVVVLGRRNGRRVVLRVGLAGTPGSPARAYEALLRLAASGSTPAPVDQGEAGPWVWSLETAITGRRVGRDIRSTLDDATAFLSGLPASTGAPRLDAELAVLRRALGPGRASELDDLGGRLDDQLAAMPSVLRHGDFWAGNLLVADRRLVGVIDWDWWADASVPGTDLLHLVATAERQRRRASLGDMLEVRPWAQPEVRERLAKLLRASGLDDDDLTLRTVEAAWWITQIAGDLHRQPELSADAGWVSSNVDRPLRSLLHRAGSSPSFD